MDNACFVWSVVVALYPARNHTNRESSYQHYNTVINLQDIQFPMTLNQIIKFENQNNISVNVYIVARNRKRFFHYDSLAEKGTIINLQYVQDPQNAEHLYFLLIKD